MTSGTIRLAAISDALTHSVYTSSYFSYKDMEDLTSEEALTELSPDLNFETSQARALPEDVLSRLPEELSRFMATNESQVAHAKDLAFLRNKHIIVLGSSYVYTEEQAETPLSC
jgi:hypothetical protein